LQRELTLSNVSDPDPPGAFRLIYGSHPTTVERIGTAVAFQRSAR
jgi:STE24 endopeptidase